MRIHLTYTLLLLSLLLAGCDRSSRPSLEQFSRALYTPTYASGFVVCGYEQHLATPANPITEEKIESSLIRVKSPWQGATNNEQQLFIVRNNEAIPQGYTGPVLRNAAKRIVCMSSSHVAMLEALGATERIVGVSGIDFVTNTYVQEHRDQIADVGYDNYLNYELLIAQEPDLVLLYGVTGANSMEPKLRELGIPYIYIGEYVEEDPLGKSEWLIVLAELIGCRKRGEALFEQIPTRYHALKELAASAATPQPKVMINTPYADSWFMASSTSYVARLIADAGGDYIYKKNTSNHSLPIDLEQAALLTSQADIWMNVGDISDLRELRSLYPKFAQMPSVVRGEVYNFDRRRRAGGGNDYWESGVVNPDLILRDLIKIFHPELVPDADFIYYRKLE